MNTDDEEKKTTVKISKKLHEKIKAIAKKDGRLVERVVADVLKKGLESEKQQ